MLLLQKVVEQKCVFAGAHHPHRLTHGCSLRIASSIRRVLLISAASFRSFGSLVWYSAASTLVGRPSRAYLATAASLLAHKIRPTGGFSPGAIQCSRA